MDRPARFAICGAGFIGLSLVEHLLATGARVSVLDRKEPVGDLGARTRWVKGSFSDLDHLRRALEGAEVAYHLVSTTVPGDDHVGLLQELADNISATIRFLEVCGEMGVGRVVFTSSSSVYGLQHGTPIDERAETTPISSHGIHKLTIEKYLLLHQFNHQTDVRIVRLSNPYGPGQHLLGRQGFVAIAIGKLLANQPVLLRGGGSPIRDFIYISDVCEGLMRVAIAESPPALLNIGTGVGHSLADVLAEVSALTGRQFETVAAPLRRADIPESVLDVTLARHSVGFAPSVGLQEGLARTLRYHGVPMVI
jgi:UDP-glucose 4-epimerase